jgi:hypothetical protein
MGNKTYEIETLEQLVNITTAENLERLATDFIYWLDYCNQMFIELRKSPENEGKSNSEIAKVKFIWTDDGEEGLTRIKLTNTNTGEITFKDLE